MFRSLFLAAVLAASILPAAPTPQSFRQPLIFEPNRGQAQPQTTWAAHGPGYQLQLTNDTLVMLFRERASSTPRTLKMKLTGSRLWSHVAGLDPTGGVSNYLNRPNGAASLSAIPHYARLRVSDVYPGVDLVLYSNNGNLEYDFVLQPGADPTQIQVAFEGQSGLRVDAPSGDLVLTTPTGSELRQMRPKVYQQALDRRVELAGAYRLLDANRAAFTLAAYDPQRPLVIDPTVQLAQFLGGFSNGQAVAVDSAGNSYLTGSADANFPVTNSSEFDDGEDHSAWHVVVSVLKAFDGPASFSASVAVPRDLFVTKLNPQGGILFSTYGGLGIGTGIAVDSSGVVVTGWRTDSPSVNITSGTGLFAWKLSLTGNPIYYSILAGGGSDTGTGVALDSQHNAWISGVTSNTGFTRGPTKATPDALALKVSPTGYFSDLKTLGGSGPDMANGIAVDGDDNPWLTGKTCSPDFPASIGFNNLTGECGVFVAKLIHQSGAATTQFVSVFGGSDSDAGLAIAVDANREAYVTGVTKSYLLYTSPGAYQIYPSGQFEQGFITQIDGFGHYIHSTFLGSSAATAFSAIALNTSGEVFVGGYTLASSFPQNGPVVPPAGMIAKLSPDLSTLYYSRQEGEEINGVALRETVPAVTPTQIFTTTIIAPAGSTSERAFVEELIDDSEYTRLRNYWITDRDINNESGVPEAGQAGPGWLSAQWTFELQPSTNGDPNNTPVFWIRNRWTGQYLNIESGSLQTTAIGPGWLSARWTFEPITGTNVYRIRNVWQPDKCLNVESGSLTASPVGPGWLSAWWFFDRVF